MGRRGDQLRYRPALRALDGVSVNSKNSNPEALLAAISPLFPDRGGDKDEEARESVGRRKKTESLSDLVSQREVS